jgi:ABC-type multidrug transport system fused ATPase/permease subunit
MLKIPSKIWGLLNSGERWQIAGLFGMVVLMGLAQVVSVGSIAPFVSVLVDPDSVHTNPQISWAYERFGFESVRSFLVFLALSVLAALVVANSFLAFTQWLMIRFSWRLQYRLSRRLLERYLTQPYVAFLQRNSADTGKNILNEVGVFTGSVLVPMLKMTAFTVAGTTIMAALFYANAFLTALILGTIGGGYALIYSLVHKRLDRAGRRRIQATTERFKIVNEAFGSIKETKVLGREQMLLRQYDGPATRYIAAQATPQLLGLLPTYSIQFLSVAVILGITLLLVGTVEGDLEEAAPLLALYAYASQRVLPFLGEIYRGIASLRFNRMVVETLYNDMLGEGPDWTPASDLAEPLESFGRALRRRVFPRRSQTSVLAAQSRDAASSPTADVLPLQREIRLENVSFQYPGTEGPSVREISLTVPYRGFIALVGSTGAGKTTIADVILGLLRPQVGELTVDGVPVTDDNMRAWQNNLGYVPQDIYLTDDTITANIAFGIPPEQRDQAAVEWAARIANIHDFVSRELPEGYDTVVGERGVRLSGGQRQRIGIARALYHDPEVLVLDEATSNLDQETEAAVHEAVQQAAAAKTVIMIAHRLSTTKDCDILYLFDHGRLVDQGSYESLLRSSDRFQAMAAAR